MAELKDEIQNAVNTAMAVAADQITTQLRHRFATAKDSTTVSAIEKSPSKGKHKLILVNPHSPGDIIMMTAAIRDLHKTYPGEYLTDVETPCPEIFEGNPYITKLDPKDPDVVKLRAEYPLIHQSNQGAYHFIHGYRKHLEELIGRPIKMGDFKPDMYIRDEEKSWVSAIEEITHDKRPYWIIDAGYKQDFTAKAWPSTYAQQVVYYFRKKIQFVQIGHAHHIHAPLKGVINMIGQTDLRQMIRLFYHAIGVLTPVSMPMVLAAGVPNAFKFPKTRACVVISGGREPVQWQHYGDHQFLHTCGTMPCCDFGGCWKSRVVPLGDGDEKDRENLCLCPVKVGGQDVAKCMASITAEDVIRAIERYYKGGVFEYYPIAPIHYDYKNRDVKQPEKDIKPSETSTKLSVASLTLDKKETLDTSIEGVVKS